MKKRSYRIVILILSLLLAAYGGFVAIVQLIDYAANEVLQKIVLIGGLILFALGIITFGVCVSCRVNYKSDDNASQEKQQSANAQVEQSIDCKATVEQSMQSTQKTVPIATEMCAAKPVRLGEKQSIEEKFGEIVKMDKTQFVIYIAQLFGSKGYRVKFTPVLDNFGVDLLVERVGEMLGVCCIQTQKVLCDSDIFFAKEGLKHYHISGGVVLTNLYFDRSAVEFARKEKLTLIDRNVLKEDFMK